GGREVVAVGSSLENRVELLIPSSGVQRTINFGNRSHPGSLVVTGLLPTEIAGPSGRTGNLYIGTDLNDAPNPRQHNRFSLTNQGASALMDAGVVGTGAALLRRGNAIGWSGRTALGYVLPVENGSSFWLQTGTPDPRSSGALMTGLPEQAQWLTGDFTSQTGRLGFLFYQRDSPTFTPREATPSESPGPPSFSSFPDQNLGAPIHLLITVTRGDGPDGLLALLDGGARAVLYDYQNGAPPVLRQSWNAPAGELFTQAAPLNNGSFLLLSGTGGRSMNWQRFDADGPSHRKTLAGPFGCKSLARRNATLFYFDQEPFVHASSKLNRMLREHDWTDLGGGLLTPFTLWTDLGPRQGLGAATGWLPPPGNNDSVLITNQFTRTATGGQAPISLATLSNAQGEAVNVIAFDPPAGLYNPLSSVVPADDGGGNDNNSAPYADTFAVRLGNATSAPMLYRLSPETPWLSYTGRVNLAGPATIYAKLTTSSLVHQASYNFDRLPAPAGSLTLPPAADTNGNGLPDSWEAAFAQSAPDADTDGDGFTALQEYQNGTDPRDKFSVTPSSPVVPTPDFPLALSMQTVTGIDGNKHLRLTWSTDLFDALLQSTGNLADWLPLSENITIEGNSIVHTALLPGSPSTLTAPARFYRLVRIPSCQ
ncbi:MAG: hypothetical protein JWL81_2856, partial [Verrucomicrobiales bacterium]|nr:hypothetical protein [Verrucomicrobiales bacterium]